MTLDYKMVPIGRSQVDIELNYKRKIKNQSAGKGNWILVCGVRIQNAISDVYWQEFSMDNQDWSE